jgi:hypothetical protein
VKDNRFDRNLFKRVGSGTAILDTHRRRTIEAALRIADRVSGDDKVWGKTVVGDELWYKTLDAWSCIECGTRVTNVKHDLPSFLYTEIVTERAGVNKAKNCWWGYDEGRFEISASSSTMIMTSIQPFVKPDRHASYVFVISKSTLLPICSCPSASRALAPVNPTAQYFYNNFSYTTETTPTGVSCGIRLDIGVSLTFYRSRYPLFTRSPSLL